MLTSFALPFVRFNFCSVRSFLPISKLSTTVCSEAVFFPRCSTQGTRTPEETRSGASMCLDLAETTSTIFQRYSILNCQTFWQTPVRKKNVLFASPAACADHFEDHSNIKQNNYLVDIVAWKLFQVISQGKLFQATRSQTRLITGSPETTNPFFFLPINTLDFLFSAQRSGSAQTPLRSPAVPARRQHDQVWRHQGGLYMRIDRSVTNAFCKKTYIQYNIFDV